MTKLLLLDKDGTLVKPRSGNEFVQHPEDQELLLGVAETIACYAADGWTAVILSNQGGVAAGYKTLDDAIAEMRYCLRLLPQISCALFCPDMEGQECYHVGSRDDFLIEAHEYWRADLRGFYRKPGKGMIDLARWQIHSASGIVNPPTLMIGYRPEDQQAAIAANIPFMWANEWLKTDT